MVLKEPNQARNGKIDQLRRLSMPLRRELERIGNTALGSVAGKQMRPALNRGQIYKQEPPCIPQLLLPIPMEQD